MIYCTYVEHYPLGFHLCPQFEHRFTVSPLPKNPVIIEYPLCPAVITVELHLGHLGIVRGCTLSQLYFCGGFPVSIIILHISLASTNDICCVSLNKRIAPAKQILGITLIIYISDAINACAKM